VDSGFKALPSLPEQPINSASICSTQPEVPVACLGPPFERLCTLRI
jgi:hypothetical protein